MGKRTVGGLSDEKLLDEYNGLFSYKPVQMVARYLAVREELTKRLGPQRLKARSAQRRQATADCK